jgi:hypothetical protein
MKDLEIARSKLRRYGWSLVIVKDGEVVFETYEHGIRGLLEAIGALGGLLKGASVADRVVGLAAALLCLYVKVKSVYAVVVSQNAVGLLRERGVYCEFEKLVPRILDKSGAAQCPFERIAGEVSSVEEAYRKLKELEEKLRKKKANSLY